MTEQDIKDLASLAKGLSPQRRRELEQRLPPYEARDRFENGYLTGLKMASEMLTGDAAREVRELLGVAASHVLGYRAQIASFRAQVNSPEYRRWLEEESARILSGEAKLVPADELLAWMEETIHSKSPKLGQSKDEPGAQPDHVV